MDTTAVSPAAFYRHGSNGRYRCEVFRDAVTFAHTYGLTKAECEARGALIAAAPAMLAALEAIAGCTGPSGSTLIRAIHDQATAALAQARGGVA